MDTEEYSITTWQSEDGLPAETIYSIAQTPDGFLWVGTLNGVARFDGVHFTALREAKELGREHIARLFVARPGELWISTLSGHLARYAEGQFKLVEGGWPLLPVHSFAQDRDGSLVLTTEAGGIFRIQHDRCEPIRAEGAVAIPAAEVAVDVWGDQSIWIRTAKAVGLLRGLNWLESKPVEGPIAERLGPLAPRRAGGIWMFASERRLELLQGERWPVLAKPYPDFMDPSVLLEDSMGSLWFGTPQQGLGRLASDGTVTRFYQGTGFPTDAIHCLFEDRDGNIWVGGRGGGLIRLTRRKFSTLPALAGTKNTAPLCLSEDAHGTLWIGFGERGLHRVDGGTLSGPVTLGGRFMKCSIWSMLAGGSDRMWFGAYGIGVFMAQGSSVKAWTLKDGLPSTDLRCFCEEPDGSLWIGTVQGLCWFDGTNFVNVTERDGLPQGPVQALTKDKSGNWWIGIETGPLVQWRDRKVTVFSSTNGLPAAGIQALLADPDGSLWIGTTGGGLCWRRNERFVKFDGRTGLPVDNIVGIVDDQLGYLWLASNHGTVRVARANLEAVADGKQAQLRVENFDRNDGLPSSRMSTGSPCAIRSRDGRLYFATLQGVAVVNPRELRLDEVMPKVVIEDVVVDGKSQLTLNAARRVIVSSGARRLEFRYTTPSLTAPERVRFQHMVEGLDKEWQDDGTERTVSYRGLRAGHYRFEVTATLRPGAEKAQSASLAFEVAPLIWETGWFRGAAALALVLAVGMVFGLRMSALERKRAAQEQFSRQLMEQQETERKRIAAELHDSLGQSLSIIQNHAVMAGTPGDINAHVAGISQAATEALESVRDICHALRPVELDRLGLSKTLRAMAERLGASSGLRIIAEIDPIDALVRTENWIHVLRFVQEAFNNVVKHARAATVKISLREDEDCLHLVIADDGCGFDPVVARGRSLGLSTMDERARILGATLRFESGNGSGTTLRLDFAPEKGSVPTALGSQEN